MPIRMDEFTGVVGGAAKGIRMDSFDPGQNDENVTNSLDSRSDSDRLQTLEREQMSQENKAWATANRGYSPDMPKPSHQIRATQTPEYKGMTKEFTNAFKQTVAGLAESFSSGIANWPDTASRLAAYKNQERLQPSTGGGFKATAARFTGEVVPQLATSLVPGVGLATVGLQEKQQGEELAREVGLSVADAETAGAIVGGVNTIIESAQIGTLLKAIGLDDGAKALLKSQAAKNVFARLAQNKGSITKATANAALQGGIEESLQQVTTIATPEIIAGRNPLPELYEKKGEIWSAFVGGAIAEGAMGGGGRALNVAITRPDTSAGTPLTQATATEATPPAGAGAGPDVASAPVRMDQFNPDAPIPSAVARPVQSMGQDVTGQMQKTGVPADTSIVGELDRIKQEMTRKYGADSMEAAKARLLAKEAKKIGQMTEDTMTQTPQNPTTVSDQEGERTSTVQPDTTGAVTEQAAPVLQDIDEMEMDVPKLSDTVNDVNPVPWSEYLKDIDLKDEKNGVKHYVSSNAHYIVYNGRVYTAYGYKGNNLFNQLVKNPKQFFDDRREIKAALSEVTPSPRPEEKVAVKEGAVGKEPQYVGDADIFKMVEDMRSAKRELGQEIYAERMQGKRNTTIETDEKGNDIEIAAPRVRESRDKFNRARQNLIDTLGITATNYDKTRVKKYQDAQQIAEGLTPQQAVALFRKKYPRYAETEPKKELSSPSSDSVAVPNGPSQNLSQLEDARKEALAAVREQAAKPVSEQVPSPSLRVVNSIAGEKKGEAVPSEKPIDPKKFYSYEVVDANGNNVSDFVEVKATKVTLPGFEKIDAFSNKGKDGTWAVTEGKTGMALGKGKTKKAAFEKALANLGRAKTPVDELIARAVEAQGMSPRYGGKAIEKAQVKEEPVTPTKAIESVPVEDVPIWGKGLQQWQMTQDEWLKFNSKEGETGYTTSGQPFKYEALTPDAKERLLRTHKVNVKQAIANKWPVPDKVLAEYPDLTAKIETETKPIQATKAVEQESPTTWEQEFKDQYDFEHFYEGGDTDLSQRELKILWEDFKEYSKEHYKEEKDISKHFSAWEDIVDVDGLFQEKLTDRDRVAVAEEKVFKDKEDAAGNSMMDFVTKVDVRGNKVYWGGDEPIYAYPDGYYPTQKDLEILHAELRKEVAPKPKDATGDLFASRDIAPQNNAGGKGEIFKDKNGEPVSVYHGTNSDFDKFEPGFAGASTKHASSKLGIFFTESESGAKEFGKNVKKANLIIKNPKIYSNTEFEEILDSFGEDWRDLFDNQKADEAFLKLKQNLIDDGYDGIIIQPEFQTQYPELNHKNYVVFEPSQIIPSFNPSATGKGGDTNTVFTQEAKDAAVARQKKKAAATKKKGKSAGFLEVFDADDIKDAVTIMGYYAERGIRTAKAFTDKAIEEMGEGIRKHLPAIWDTLKAQNIVTGEYVIDDTTPPTPPIPPAPKPAPKETSPKEAAPEYSISNKNAVVEEKRQEKGLPPLKDRQRQSNEETLQKARAILAKDPTADVRLVEELRNKPRPLSVEEEALILHRLLQLDLEANNLTEKLQEAINSKNADNEFTIRQMLTRYIEEFTEISEINAIVGRDAARTMQFRTRLVDQNYTLIDMLEKMTAAEGRELTAKEVAQITDLQKKLQEANASLKQALDRQAEDAAKIKELEAQKVVESIKASRNAAAPRKTYGSKNRLVTQEQYEADLKALISSGLNVGLDPAKFVAATRIGLYHIEAMSRKVANVSYEIWSNQMRKDLGDAVRPHLKDIWENAQGQIVSADREDLLKKLKEVVKEGDNSEIGRVVKQLSHNTIASGKEDLKTVISTVFGDVKDILPDITELDVLDILVDDGVYKEKNLSDTQKAIKEFEKQAKRAKTLLDIAEGKVKPSRKHGVVDKSDAVKQLDDWITKQKKEMGLTAKPLTESQIIDRLDRKAAELKDRIRTGDFAKRTRRPPLLSSTIIARMATVNRLKKEFDERHFDALVKKMPLGHKIYSVILDMPGMIKNAMTGGEISTIGRQLLPTAFVDADTYVEAVKRTLQAYKDPDYANTIEIETESHPKYYAAYKYGNVQFSKAGSFSTEEVIASKWINKIPVLGSMYKRGSAAFVAPLNWARMQLFDVLTEQYSKQGKLSDDYMVSPSEQDILTMERLGKWINDLTMRSSFGRSQTARKILTMLNYVSFAPRYSLAKMNLVNTMFGVTRSVLPTIVKTTDANGINHYKLHNQFDRILLRQSAEALGKFLAFNLLLSMAAYFSDPEDNKNIFDPESADFMKIKDGNERFDFTAGLGAMVRFMTQMATGHRRSESGRRVQEDRLKILWRFLRSKEAPVINLICTLYTGQNMMGVPTSRLKAVWDSFSMLFLNDAVETFQNSGLIPAVKALSAGVIGIGVQSYKKKAYLELQTMEDSMAMSLYGTTWDKLTPKQTKVIQDLPDYKELAIKKDQEDLQEPFEFNQSEALFEAGQRIYQGLPEAAREILYGQGILSIGIGDEVEGMKLNEERLAEYERLVSIEIEKDLGRILRTKNTPEDTQKEINKSKGNARETLVKMIDKGEI